MDRQAALHNRKQQHHPHRLLLLLLPPLSSKRLIVAKYPTFLALTHAATKLSSPMAPMRLVEAKSRPIPLVMSMPLLSVTQHLSP